MGAQAQGLKRLNCWSDPVEQAARASCGEFAAEVRDEFSQGRAAIFEQGGCIAICSLSEQGGRCLWIDAIHGRNAKPLIRSLCDLAQQLGADIRAETHTQAHARLYRRWAKALQDSGVITAWAVNPKNQSPRPTSTKHLIWLQVTIAKPTTLLAMETR